MKVTFNNLAAQWESIKSRVTPRLENLFTNSQYINGYELKTFENNFTNFINTPFLGVSNGTDAIKLAVESVKIYYNLNNCLVCIPANTFIATALGVKQANTPSFIKLVDCDEYYQLNVNLLNSVLKDHRHLFELCIILGVHLYGHCCDVKSILELCNKYNAVFIEDSAQSHGTINELGIVGSLGEAAAFSFYPGKNLGACGDAGGVSTKNSDIYDIIKSLRNLGTGSDKYHYDYCGYNNRLDTIQAIILDEKLRKLPTWNERRIDIARIYNENLDDKVIKPKVAPYCKKHTYHLYVIQVKDRDGLALYLNEKEVETGLHYPIPIEDTGLFTGGPNLITRHFSKTILSLPIHPFMSDEEVLYVCNKVNEYVK